MCGLEGRGNDVTMLVCRLSCKPETRDRRTARARLRSRTVAPAASRASRGSPRPTGHAQGARREDRCRARLAYARRRQDVAPPIARREDSCPVHAPRSLGPVRAPRAVARSMAGDRPSWARRRSGRSRRRRAPGRASSTAHRPQRRRLFASQWLSDEYARLHWRPTGGRVLPAGVDADRSGRSA